MLTKTFPRVAFTFGALAVSLIYPWWITVLTVLILIFFFDYYLEAILVGLVLDSAYSLPFLTDQTLFWPIEPLFGLIFTFTAVMAIFIAEKIKNYLSFY